MANQALDESERIKDLMVLCAVIKDDTFHIRDLYHFLSLFRAPHSTCENTEQQKEKRRNDKHDADGTSLQVLFLPRSQ